MIQITLAKIQQGSREGIPAARIALASIHMIADVRNISILDAFGLVVRAAEKLEAA